MSAWQPPPQPMQAPPPRPCAQCTDRMDMTRAVWWTSRGACCTERCARLITALEEACG